MSSTGPLSELESLRWQVAALTRTLAERDQVRQDGPEQANLLRAIVEGTAADIGVEFFRSLVKHLAKALNVRYAFVGEWREPTAGKVRTLAVWSGTDFAEPFDYDLKGAPCEHVIGQQLCLHESGVQERFPDDRLLVQWEVQSYCGMPLFDRSGTALGLLVVMDDRPFTRAPLIKDLLHVFATRAAAELQRQRVEMTLQAQERRLRFTQFSLNHAADAVLWADDATKFIYANEAACRSLGYSNEELLTLSISDIAPHHNPVQFRKRRDRAKQGTAVMYESVHRRKDGTEFPIEVSVTYLEQDGRGYTCGIVRDITERKQKEQERLQALHDLQNIVETVPDFMFTLDLQGNMVKWNRRVEEVTGYSAKELLNMPALAFVPPEAAARTAAAIQQAFTEGYAQLDGNLLTKDHRLIPYHWTGALLKNLQGEPIGITGIGRDVTEKKRAEAALQQERQHLVEAQALAHLGSWEWDIESGEEVWSDEQYRIFGYEPGSISVVYETFMAALLPDDHDRVLAAINDALMGDSRYEVECRIVRPNGDVREIQCRGDVHRDEAGRPIRMAGTVLDITERKHIEAALRTSEERWHLAVQGSNDGIWDWNIRTGEVFFSSRWKAMRGFGDREVSNHLDEWRSRIHPDDLDRVLQQVDAYLANQAPEFCEEYRVQRKDGSYMWILDRGAALWGDDGTPLRMTGSETDITHRKELEQQHFEQEERLRLAMEIAELATWDWNIHTNRVLWSDNCEQVKRLQPGTFSGTLAAYQQLVHPDDRPQVQADIAQALTEQSVYRSEHRIVPPGGDVQWVESNGHVYCDEMGRPIRMLGTVRNITVRKRMEEALRESEERFSLAATGSHDALWDAHPLPGEPWYAPQTPVWWSPRVREWLGLDESEPFEVLEQWAVRLHPEDKERIFGRLAAHIEQRVPYDAEYRLRTNRGDYRWIRGRGQATWDEQGRPRRMSGSCQDITERKQAEQIVQHRLEFERLIACLSTHFINLPSIDSNAGINQALCSIGEFIAADRSYVFLFSDDGTSMNNVHEWCAGGIVPQIDNLQGLPTDSFPWIMARHRRGEVTHLSRLANLPPEACAEKEEFEREGIQSLLTVPIGSAYGVIGFIGFDRVRVERGWEDDDIALLKIVGEMLENVFGRTRAEEALRDSQDNLRQALQASNIGLWDWNTDTNEVSFSSEWKRQIGYEEAEITDAVESWEGRLHPDDYDGVVQFVRAYITNPIGAYQQEFRLRHKDGTYRWIEARASFVTDPDGRRVRLLGSHVDITARKQAAERLRRTQYAVDHATEYIFVIGRDGYVLDVNHSACCRLGYTKEELLTKSVMDIDPDFSPGIWETFWKEFTEKKLLRIETRHRSKSGEIYPVEVVATYILHEGQELDYAFVRDISDRKQAENKLRLTQFTIDHATDAVYWINQAAQIVNVNAAAGLMLGYSNDELRAMTVYDLNPDLPPDRWPSFWAETQQQKTMAFETFHRSKAGQLIPVEVSVNYLSYEGQELHCAFVRNITERKQTQEALAQRESQLQTVLDSLPVGVWFTDLSGKSLLANPAARQIWSGIKQIGIETAAHPAGWWEAIGPSSEPHRWALGQALTKGVPSLYETLDFECLDGTRKTIRNTAVPVQDATGVVVGAIVLNEDITALRRAQEAIKLTQFSIDHAVEAFFWIDPDAKILHVNEAACRMLEYTSDELTAMTVHDIDPNFPPELWSAHWEDLKQKGSMSFESKHWSRTGRVLDTEITVNYLQYEGKEYNCAIMRDIGERKRADAALRASEERYRALYDETPTMYFTLAMDGTVRSVNRFGAEQLGYQVEELVGHSVLRIFHEDDTEAVSTSLSECLMTPETTKHWEFRNVRKDGRIIWVRETARAGQSSSGETVLLVTCEDITARKQAEAHQSKQYDQLQAIFRMTMTLSRASSLDDIYREAIDCMRQALKADRASILLFDEAGVMRFKASQGLSEQYQAAVEGHSPWTREAIAPQPILVDDIAFDPSVDQYREIFRAEGFCSLGFIPLVLSEGLLGKFMIYYDRPHQFTDEEVGVAQTIAGHVAYMIQRTRVDQALRVSEERYRSLVDHAPIGIFLNEAGRFTYVNREMQRILRASRAEQLLGTPVLERIAPEFHPIVQARIQQLIEKGQPVPTLDEQYVGLDGSRVDVAVTAIPTTFNGATVIQVLVLDITERKEGEEALREKHALLSTIMDATADIIFVKDLQGRYLHMNLAGARAVGMSVEEVVGKDDDAMWPEDLAACCKEADRKILASGAAQTMEESTTVDGQRITYLTTKAPYRDAVGRMIGIIGVAHDISQMKRSEEELRRSHAFLRQVIDIDPNFVFAKDRAGRFTLVNKAVADAYGTTVENLIGKTDADFNADQKEVAFFRETDLGVLNSLQDLFLPEEAITDSTGKMRWLQTVKRPILDEQGRAIMVLGAATDITERKRMEEALRQRERDLRTAIEERERISQDLHDGILQSLFAVGLTLETTKSMMSLKERKTSGPALQQAIDQLNRLMHEVRNFIAGLGSDLLQGKDLPTALQHMIETLTKHHPTHVRLKIEDRAAQALSAEQSLHLLLVIQEAVSNCIRHGHAQEARVSLKLLKQGIRLSVRDNGCGFDSAASKGIGHGLANMAARAQKIGGRLTVLSKTNEGTRVVLDLPKEAVLAHS